MSVTKKDIADLLVDKIGVTFLTRLKNHWLKVSR